MQSNSTTRGLIDNDQFSPTELLVQHEQTRLLYEALPVAAVATLANVLVLSFVQWNVIDHNAILTWAMIMVVITLVRMLIVYRYKRESPGYQRSVLWKNRFNIGAIAAGLGWGGAVLFLFPGDALPYQVLLGFVIAGTCAGAVTSLSFMLLPIRAFLLLSLLPITFKFLVGNTIIMQAMGVMSMLFFITLWVSSKRIYTNTLQNIRLRYESRGRQHALQESEARYRLIFDSAPVGIVQFNHDGNILALNRAFEELIGESAHKLIGQSLASNAVNNTVVEQVSKALTGETGYFTGVCRDVAGVRDVPLRAYFRGLPIAGKEAAGGVAIFEDISEDKRVERMKDEFISTVSHELRTPLTSIHGSLGLLGDTTRYQLPDNVTSLLDIANRNTERLLLLIDDILDIGKIEAGKLELKLEKTEVMPFVTNAIEANRAYAHKFQVEFCIIHREDNLFIQADRHRLMQVFNNLLSNAAKFSDKGTTVDIAVYQKQDVVRIEVIDRGIGIAEQFQPHVFEKFAQYDASDTKRTDGTGLGLSITRAIVEHHDGEIGFHSTEGQGTIFFVELPLQLNH